MTNISAIDRSLSLREGRTLPDEAIFSNMPKDCFTPPGFAMTKWPLSFHSTLRVGFALRRPARTSRTNKDGDRQERFNPIHAENHAQSGKIASKKGLKIAEKMNQAYFLSYIALISIYKLK